MATYDHYEPGVLRCLDCDEELGSWTEGDGPGRFFLYRLGARQPVDQLADIEVKVPLEDYQRFRLPKHFVIVGSTESGHFVSATGICDGDGCWSETWLHHGSWRGCPGLG